MSLPDNNFFIIHMQIHTTLIVIARSDFYATSETATQNISWDIRSEWLVIDHC